MNSKELNNKFEISKVYMSDYTIRWKRYKVQGLEHLSLRQRLNSFKSLEQGVKSALIIMLLDFVRVLARKGHVYWDPKYLFFILDP